MYGKLLATKLRKYPESMRQRMMYKIDGFLLENPPNTADFRCYSSTPSPAHTIASPSSYIISQSPGYTISPSPSCIISQSPGHTIPPSPVSITIPEDYNFTEAQLNMVEDQNRINILSQEILTPPNNSRNIITTAFLNTEN